MPMNEQRPSIVRERRVSRKDRDHFNARVVETLLGNFRDIESKAPPQDKHVLVGHLFKTENIKALLGNHGVTQEDDLSVIINKLETALIERERAKTIIRPSEIEEQIQSDNDNEKEERRDHIMDIQEKLNELYTLNNADTDAEEQLKSALARLEIFASDKDEEGRVEVVRTQGVAEVLFEEDIQDKEKLDEAALDISGTAARIEEYKKNLGATSEPPQGVLKRFFRGNYNPEGAPSQELEGKIRRGQMKLAEKIEETMAREERFQARRKEKDQALREPLLVSGMDSFSGTWGELLQQLRAGVRQAQESVEADFKTREEEIKVLEEERESLEGARKAV